MAEKTGVPTPAISLPQGGGAVKGIGETFQPNLFTGTGNFSIPIATSPGRSGFGPQLTLQYSTGNGNGPFGLGWQLSFPRITRKTEKGLPTYDDKKDVFILSGAEDLVPFLNDSGNPQVIPDQDGHSVTRFRPRTEGLFARIEKWVRQRDGDIHWRVTTKENVTCLYGKTNTARVVDPNNDQHIFEWLLEETFDAKGNHILYEYVRDQADLKLDKIYEQNRQYTQVYIRRILYGNTPNSLLPENRAGPVREVDPHADLNRHYVFEVLFDYGDLKKDLPVYEQTSVETRWWDQSKDDLSTVEPRQDTFSSYRSRFEIRTLRLCRRVLMLHHFKEGELEGAPLVKSTDFGYENNKDTGLSLLTSVKVTGYRKDPLDSTKYLSRDLPPVTFKYSEFKPQEQRYQSVTANGNDLPPRSLIDPDYTLIDLFGDGLPDILNTTPYGYYYWENLGEARIDRRHPQHAAPAGVILSDVNVAIGDMGGDGLPDLIVEAPSMFGFYEAAPDGTWKKFKRFDDKHTPSFSLADPNVRLVDLTGDGLSDMLVTLDHHFLWFECKGEKGYADPVFVERKHNLDEFPDVYFSDPTGRVRLADMNGDGLNDIVLVHEGRIEYWPNSGYGRFGKRITMACAPRLERNFDPRRLFLVDLDGSGCADVVYVDAGSVHFWFNQSGNSWSGKQTIPGTPAVTDFTSIQFADFYGTGTACLVWSYDYNSQPGGNYKVLDFCGGKKPYLLREMSNNMGATTRAQYAPSTNFYLEDKRAGQPWVTNLPFPVQVLEKTEVIDHISKTKLVTTYKYHHGYYDGREREFRGFGRVDQYDTEEFNTFVNSSLHKKDVAFANNKKAFHLPPVWTKNWFHTGVYFDENLPSSSGTYYDKKDMMAAYRAEFYHGDELAFQFDDHEVNAIETPHAAYRALRGSLIRSETYASDDTDKAEHPYTVTENRYLVKRLQPKEANNHAVYQALQKESVSYHYERNPNDPRVAHQINIKYDEYGNLLETAAISYPRRNAEGKLYLEQSEPKAIYAFNRFINEDKQPNYYYIGLPCETKMFEVYGLRFQWPGNGGVGTAFTSGSFASIGGKKEYEDYDYVPPENLIGLKKRLIEWTRQYYRKDLSPEVDIDPIGDLSHRLDFGIVESRALPYESYRAAFTNNFINKILQPTAISDIEFQNEGGYHQETQQEPGSDADSKLKDIWWIPSGRQAFTEVKFYLSEKTQDPFGNQTSSVFDDYALLLDSVTDAMENKVTAKNDYRVVQPSQITDPNDNISQVAFDALGLVVGTAIMGTDRNGNSVGDSLEGFVPDLPQNEIDAHRNDPRNNPHDILKSATTRLVYDLHRYEKTQRDPNVIYTMARETHHSDEMGEATKIQHSFIYSDGFGREVQTKLQAEPGLVNGIDIQNRWAATGTRVWNNKGKEIQHFESFFSDTHEYGIEQHGVSPILFYDPLERAICTLHPNHTYEKVVFDAWKVETWDANDTIHPTERYDPRSPNELPDPSFNPVDDKDIGQFLLKLQEMDENTFLPTWYDLRVSDAKALEKWPDGDGNLRIRVAEKRAAQNAAKHAATPATSHLDCLGRQFMRIADNGKDKDGKDVYFTTYVELDIEGNDICITDPRKVKAFEHTFDMAGRKLVVNSKDAGIRTNLPDVSGEKPWRVWDSNGNEIKTDYDPLRRPIKTQVTKNGQTRLVNQTTYGDEADFVDAKKSNLRGRVYRILDDAGVIINSEYDFKGNLVETQRTLLQNYKLEVDWSQNPRADLEAKTYTTKNKHDALNRITESTAPDESIHKITYNDANFLETVKVRLKGEVNDRDFVKNIDYNARGQREKIDYGNNVSTDYTYDPETYRLISVVSKKSNGAILQDLHYTYDPVGNIAQIFDGAFHTVFNQNDRIDPISKYIYDATYRLIEALGREHEAMTACHYQTNDKKHIEFVELSDQPINNGRALHNYEQFYQYDENGNITQIRHIGHTNWTRDQEYQEDSNRLKSSIVGLVPCAGEANFEYSHDKNGNIEKMPHLREMKWDYANRLIEVETNFQTNATNDRVFYDYDASGQRVRKVIEQGNVRVEERIYVGGYEIYRKYSGATFERSTLHVMDDKKRIALIETEDPNNISAGSKVRVRYQFDNHLGSSLLEVDEDEKEISYEEYYPYGGTTYLAGESWDEVKLKRYRYSGKERDDETGLYYYGARCYAPWLGRWTSVDPLGSIDNINLYLYSQGNPVLYTDKIGTQSEKTDDQKTMVTEVNQVAGSTSSNGNSELQTVSSRNSAPASSDKPFQDDFSKPESSNNKKNETNRKQKTDAESIEYGNRTRELERTKNMSSVTAEKETNQWGKFGRISERYIGVKYGRNSKPNIRTGELKRNEMGEQILACTSFVDTVLSQYEYGSIRRSQPDYSFEQRGFANIFEAYGFRDPINLNREGFAKTIEKLDKSRIYGLSWHIISTDKPQHVVFLVYSNQRERWVTVQASKAKGQVGIFNLKGSVKQYGKVYDLGAIKP